MKKLVTLFLTFCLGLTLCCVAFAEDPIVLDFWVRLNDDFSDEIAAFEATHPGIVINQIGKGSSYDDLVMAYNAAILANELPEVGMVGQRHGIPQLYDAGVLLPIENFLTEEEQADVIDGFWYRYTYEGLRLAVPFQSSMPMLHYNETMLNELGLEVPTTLTEMIECARQAVKDVDGDGAIDIYGFNMAGDVPFYIQPMVWGLGGTIIDEDGNVNVVTDEMVKVYSMFAEMVQEGIMPANQHSSAETDFCNGLSLFFMASCASKGSVERVIGDSFVYNTTYFPASDGELNVCIGGNGLAIFASTDEKQEAAAEFIRYMISPEAMRESTLRQGYVPFTNAQFADEYIQGQMQDPRWALVLDQVQYIRGQHVHPADSTIWNEMSALLSEVEAYPDMDITAALEKMQAEIDEFMMMY